MSVDSADNSIQKSTLEFKTSSFSVPTLVLTNNDIALIKQELQHKITQARGLFKHSPLLVDLQELKKQQLEIDLRELVSALRELEFLPIAIAAGTDTQNKTAIELGIAAQAIHATHTPKSESEAEQLPELEEEPESEEEFEAEELELDEERPLILVQNKLITTPVRSGQRIYAKGDLIVLASVSAGAELIAEGNIHVYAPLRGRALAGVLGNTDSRIFCSSLQAELVSIAGSYRLCEDLDKNLIGEAVQIYLQGQALIIEHI